MPLHFVSGVGIHLREKNIVYPTERSRGGKPPTQAHREGYTFFDEDDAYVVILSLITACLNSYPSEYRVQIALHINQTLLPHCGQFSCQGTTVNA